jgi:DnaJ-class molecular chaperone
LARQYYPDFQTNADAATKKQAATMFDKITKAYEELDRKKQLKNEEVWTFNSAARETGLSRQTPLEPQRTSPSAATQLAALPPAQEAPAVQQGKRALRKR